MDNLPAHFLSVNSGLLEHDAQHGVIAKHELHEILYHENEERDKGGNSKQFQSVDIEQRGHASQKCHKLFRGGKDFAPFHYQKERASDSRQHFEQVPEASEPVRDGLHPVRHFQSPGFHALCEAFHSRLQPFYKRLYPLESV